MEAASEMFKITGSMRVCVRAYHALGSAGGSRRLSSPGSRGTEMSYRQ